MSFDLEVGICGITLRSISTGCLPKGASCLETLLLGCDTRYTGDTCESQGEGISRSIDFEI